jgi:cytochrome b561
MFSKFRHAFQSVKRYTTATAIVETYSKPLRWTHFIQALGFCGIVSAGFVAARIDGQSKDTPVEKKELKKDLMHLHKSVALIMFGLIAPRLYFRFKSKIPPTLGTNRLETLAGQAGHLAMYAAIIGMPVTGVSMGYFSGYGVPFFRWHLPGAPKEKADTPFYKSMRAYSFKVHHYSGVALEFLIPLHISAAGFHFMKGQKIFARMNPFK